MENCAVWRVYVFWIFHPQFRVRMKLSSKITDFLLCSWMCWESIKGWRGQTVARRSQEVFFWLYALVRWFNGVHQHGVLKGCQAAFVTSVFYIHKWQKDTISEKRKGFIVWYNPTEDCFNFWKIFLCQKNHRLQIWNFSILWCIVCSFHFYGPIFL